MITEGKMQYLFDEKGRRYLDVSLILCTRLGHHSFMQCNKHADAPQFLFLSCVLGG